MRTKRKPKFVTVQVPWEEVGKGDKLECPGGYDEVLAVERPDNNTVLVRYVHQGTVSYHRSNWPSKPVELADTVHGKERQVRAVNFLAHGQRVECWLPEGYYVPGQFVQLDGKTAMELWACNGPRERWYVSESAYHTLRNVD